jgi:hypothetical protein
MEMEMEMELEMSLARGRVGIGDTRKARTSVPKRACPHHVTSEMVVPVIAPATTPVKQYRINVLTINSFTIVHMQMRKPGKRNIFWPALGDFEKLRGSYASRGES